MNAQVFSDTVCTLGEGPLWHPEEQALYWFDIMAMRLYRRDQTGEVHWQFDEHVSAGGWIDKGVLLIASETALFEFDTQSGESTFLKALEADNPVTRSNDGRADPWGGFWIGTMGKEKEAKAGAIYRYVDGRLHKLFDKITTPNAICFAPDRSCAHFTDTRTRKIMRVSLDGDGFPDAKPELFVDLWEQGVSPDGAVVDASGRLWVALWGAGQVSCYDTTGALQSSVDVGGVHSSCPAFGGPDLDRLYVTTAAQGRDPAGPGDGLTYVAPVATKGQQEHRVLL
ncbi:SMP-30/gluconolactonase/LRE family protein [Marivita sp. S2033]|uniref:SMP-30/gluconolactonase/LRE family protein n=1 Tax=Marivita sp. S2033 TaxID=3373187 RepID=UPI0039828286